MITFLRGRLVESLPTLAVMEVGGVGYEALIPVSSFDRLPPAGSETLLLTHLVVREDSQTLYGFVTSAERDLFRLLINTVSGVGPKMALNLLSGMPVDAFRAAVRNSDAKALAAISGIGKKTAERIIVELRDKVGDLGPGGTAPTAGANPAAGGGPGGDAIAALITLGFKPNEATEAIRGALALLGPDATVDRLVRACLKKG